MNRLFLGDCLEVLKGEVDTESVDLVYIDPPFNSKRNYNIFFDDSKIHTQRVAFEDTWSFKNVSDSLEELNTLQTEDLFKLLKVYSEVSGHSFPYLVMMGSRIVEFHRVLKNTGSFYIHLDPTMSHYIKTICDVVFGHGNFRNEITWVRTNVHNDVRGKYDDITDVILFYSKSDDYYFSTQFTGQSDEYIQDKYTHVSEEGRKYRLDNLTSPNPRPNLTYEYKGYKPPSFGWRVSREKMEQLDQEGRLHLPKDKSKRIQLRRFLEETKGLPLGNVWTDIPPLNSQSNERLGYPTQKPKQLLDRILLSSSQEGDVVLDGFCGCGTTLDSSEGLKRKWIGIDISPLSISLVKKRLEKGYGSSVSKYEVRGFPTDFPSAVKLWEENPFGFQDWWLTELDVLSTTYGKKGSDKGLDGQGLYVVDNKGTTVKVGFQVKGGEKVQSKDMDSLLGTMEKHKCSMGVFLTVTPPTKPMMETVVESGFFGVSGFKYPRLQVLTLEDFFSGKRPKLPSTNITYKSAKPTKKSSGELGLDL